MLATIFAIIALHRPERVWAIGDMHGDAGCARHWVERTGLIANISEPPDKWRWMEPSSKLVFMGDFIDRGPDNRAVLQFVLDLTERFADRVHALLGNHELNLLVDRTREPGFRYLDYPYAVAHPSQYLAWLDDLPGGRRADDVDVLRDLDAALLKIYRQNLHSRVQMVPDGPRSIASLISDPEARERARSALRRWQTAYFRGVSSRTPLGKFLHRPLSVHLADTLFVHGGVPESLLTRSLPLTASTGASSPQPTILNSLAAFEELNLQWQNVTRAGRVGRLAPRVGETSEQAAASEAQALVDSGLEAIASELVEYRGMHESYASRYQDRHSGGGRGSKTWMQVGCDRVVAVLQALNVSRLAVGHTPEANVRIRCGGRLLALDSTLSRSFRAYGNNYCNAGMEVADPRVCPPRNEACEGQIVRLERSDAQAAWVLHVVESESGVERDEGGVEEMKLEL